MNRRDAARILSVTTDADAAEVRGAYLRAIKADHPDYGGTGANITQLVKAHDVMLSQGAISPCTLCRGVGYTRSRFGAQRCTACGGSGDRP